jgi:hypothetical protein
MNTVYKVVETIEANVRVKVERYFSLVKINTQPSPKPTALGPKKRSKLNKLRPKYVWVKYWKVGTKLNTSGFDNSSKLRSRAKKKSTSLNII